MPKRIRKKTQKTHKRRQSRRKRRLTRRLRGGDYRIATVTTEQSIPLPSSAGVSIAGQSGVLSLEQYKDRRERMLLGEKF